MSSTAATIADLAEQLCDPRQHVERVPYWDKNRNKKHREWRTVQPGLLEQLHQAAVEPVDGRTEPGPKRVQGSRPPLALEALSTHSAISAYAARWCWSLELDLRDTTEANVRAIVGAAATMDSDTIDTLAAEMRQWLRWAAVATGWRAPLFAPRVACPACDQVGKLRINLAAQAAHCRACQATWAADDGSIYLLGEHVRLATDRVAA